MSAVDVIFTSATYTLNIYLTTASKLKEIISVRSYRAKYYLLSDTKKLATLNTIGVLLTGVLVDLCAHNFVHTKTSLHAHCMHTRNHVHNLSTLIYIFGLSYKKGHLKILP